MSLLAQRVCFLEIKIRLREFIVAECPSDIPHTVGITRIQQLMDGEYSNKSHSCCEKAFVTYACTSLLVLSVSRIPPRNIRNITNVGNKWRKRFASLVANSSGCQRITDVFPSIN